METKAMNAESVWSVVVFGLSFNKNDVLSRLKRFHGKKLITIAKC